MVRPTFEQIYMSMAAMIAQRSTCKRLHVGSVITSVDHRQVLAVGYNGNASGLDNTCDTNIPSNCGCLHSEENSIINCHAPREQGKNFYVTTMPCRMCCKRIINLGGVQTVYYWQEYRLDGSQELLESVGISIIQQEPLYAPETPQE